MTLRLNYTNKTIQPIIKTYLNKKKIVVNRVENLLSKPIKIPWILNLKHVDQSIRESFSLQMLKKPHYYCVFRIENVTFNRNLSKIYCKWGRQYSYLSFYKTFILKVELTNDEPIADNIIHHYYDSIILSKI